MVFNATFKIFQFFAAVSFIGGGNRTTRRIPPTCRTKDIGYKNAFIKHNIRIASFQFRTN